MILPTIKLVALATKDVTKTNMNEPYVEIWSDQIWDLPAHLWVAQTLKGRAKCLVPAEKTKTQMNSLVLMGFWI